MTVLYGISNCDTVKKARKWLDTAGVPYTFHDFRQDGLSEALARSWIDELGWEAIVNRRSTTWRAIDEDAKSEMTASTAVVEILNAPTLIKRPVLEADGVLNVGFSADRYAEIFG